MNSEMVSLSMVRLTFKGRGIRKEARFLLMRRRGCTHQIRLVERLHR